MADLIKGLLYLILGLLAIGLILIALIWAFYGVIYLIIIGISVLLVLGNPEKWGKNTDFKTNISLIGGLLLAGLLALIPTILFLATNEQETAKIPEGSIMAGFQCGLILCIILLGISVYYKIVNKIFNMNYDNYTLLIVAEILTLLQGIICSFSIHNAVIHSQIVPYLAPHNYLHMILLAFVFSIIAFVYKLYSENKKHFLYIKGDKLYDKGKYKEAIEFYNKAKGFDTSNSPYYFYAMGLAYLGLEDYTQALYEFERAINVNDTYPEFYYAIADTYLQLDDYKSGLNYIDKLLNKLDKDSKKYKECEQFKADYLKQKENLDNERKSKRAKEFYEEAIKYKNFSEYGKAKNSIKQAIELEPDNKNYETLLQEIQKSYKEEKAKFEELYNKAIKLKEEGKYQKSLNIVEEAYRIAKKQDISTANLDKLNKELSSIFKDLKNAEEKYNTAMTLYKNKEFSNAVFNMERAISLAPKNALYQNKLVEIQKEWDKQKTRAEELFFEAKSHLQNNDFSKALSSINSALNMIIDNRYTELKSDIERQQKQVQNKKDSEKLYKEAEKLYNSNHINYERIIELLESANKKYPKTKYQDFLKNIKSERNTVQAERFYERAKKDFENKNYEPAISSINEAIKLIPSNNMYIDLKQKITWEQRKYESDKKAEQLYNTGIKAYNNGDFTSAVDNLTKACNEKPDNEEWKNLLEKAQTGKIDITTCTKNALMTLDFIDNEKAEQIIKARNDGNIWYGYEEFAQAFSLQPHQYADIEAKISFPLKQGNKYGRRLDI